jgi:hypothetical protein
VLLPSRSSSSTLVVGLRSQDTSDVTKVSHRFRGVEPGLSARSYRGERVDDRPGSLRLASHPLLASTVAIASVERVGSGREGGEFAQAAGAAYYPQSAQADDGLPRLEYGQEG